MDFEQFYLDHRALIDRTIFMICRRNRTVGADADDFASTVHLHLVQNDYAVLRAFEGRSEIAAFLQAVIRRLFQDWRNANWGRWRPSAAVRRQGPVAILLETLLVRDKLSLHEAIEVLRTNHAVTETPEVLEALADRFPPRAMRSFTTEDALETRADDSSPASDYSNAESRIERAETATATARVSTALDGAISALPAQDQIILRMHCEEEVQVSTIGRVLGLDAQPLYRRIRRLLSSLRAALEHAGVTADDARDVIARRGFDFLDGDTPASARGKRLS